MNEIIVKTEDGKEIISLGLTEYMNKECAIIAMMLDAHQIYTARGRLNRVIHKYENTWG